MDTRNVSEFSLFPKLRMNMDTHKRVFYKPQRGNADQDGGLYLICNMFIFSLCFLV